MNVQGATSMLEALGAPAECIAAARLLRAPIRGEGEATAIAIAARRALDVRWRRDGRTPAQHAIEAIIALTRNGSALFVAVAFALSRLESARESADGAALAHEAIAVWAPLAERFGLGTLQRDLEDLAFEIAYPEAHASVARFVSLRLADRDHALDAARATLEATLREAGITATVTGRAKHLWSIHRKLSARGDRGPTLYDLFGLRAILDEDDACYEAIGVIHAAFPSLAGRFKDYIARPKQRGYRSLHTVVQMPGALDHCVEIQVRSKAMHASAEHGAASHLRYKHPSFREVDGDRFIYVLTPKGEVRRLPKGATPLDFAYAIHTDLGRRYVGARLGAKVVTLDTKLCTGDVVQILHSARARPTRGQLSRVRTARARNRIRAALVA